jgi:transposase
MADGRDMPPTFVRPDLGSFCRLDELGLRVVGQRLEPGRAVLACRVIETDEFARWCRRCGCQAAPRDSVTRRLAHEPLGWRPTTLLITIRRYRCTGCGHEAINRRLEHLRGSALGFRNLTNYIARSLLETGGFRSRLHPRS